MVVRVATVVVATVVATVGSTVVRVVAVVVSTKREKDEFLLFSIVELKILQS